MSATVKRLFVYPIKSLDRVELSETRITKGGSLMHDREFALFDKEGKYIRGKSNALVHSIRSQFDLPGYRVELSAASMPASGSLHLIEEAKRIEEWMSDYFKQEVRLARNAVGGFPDDTAASGPTVVSQATLQMMRTWFPTMDSDEESSRRFRSNIEIGDVPAFWEDRLFGFDKARVPFQIGNVEIFGVNPCARCIVPSRHPETGESIKGFAKDFANHRKETESAQQKPERFDHFYRLAVNTLIEPTQSGKLIQVGDKIRH